MDGGWGLLGSWALGHPADDVKWLRTDVDLELEPGRQFWNVTNDGNKNYEKTAWMLRVGVWGASRGRPEPSGSSPTGVPQDSASALGLVESVMYKSKIPTPVKLTIETD